MSQVSDEQAPRIQAAEALPDDDLDRSLRPRRLEDFVGQEAVKDQLAVSRFAQSLASSGIRRIIQLHLFVAAHVAAEGPLAGCGLVAVNPPFTLKQDAEVMLPYLAEVLRFPPAVLGFRSAEHAEAAALLPGAEIAIDPTFVTELIPPGQDVLAAQAGGKTVIRSLHSEGTLKAMLEVQEQEGAKGDGAPVVTKD